MHERTGRDARALLLSSILEGCLDSCALRCVVLWCSFLNDPQSIVCEFHMVLEDFLIAQVDRVRSFDLSFAVVPKVLLFTCA